MSQSLNDIPLRYQATRENSENLKKSLRDAHIVYWICVCVLTVPGIWIVISGIGTSQESLNRIFGILMVAPMILITPIIRKVFYGRLISSMCDDITKMTRQGKEFRDSLHKVLIAAPWSKHQFAFGWPPSKQIHSVELRARDGFLYIDIEDNPFSITVKKTMI